VHDLYQRLLIPTMVGLRENRGRVFGVFFVVVKLLYRPEDWPDPDPIRGKKIASLISDNFMDEKDIARGAWFVSRFEGVSISEEFIELVCDNPNALINYCDNGTEEMQFDMVSRWVAKVFNAPPDDRSKRRDKWTVATNLIDRYKLDHHNFPEVCRRKALSWMCHFVHRRPLHVSEDYAYGDAELMSVCVQQLFKYGSLGDAAALYQRHSALVKSSLPPEMVTKLDGVAFPSIIKPDTFGPGTSEALCLLLPEANVIWVGTSAVATAVEASLLQAPIIAIDLEWSQLGDWLQPDLSLMQLATPEKVFLVDLAAEGMRQPVFGILRALLRSTLVGFAFQNDISMLRKSHWAAVSEEFAHLCDLQELTGGSSKEGLAALVQRTLGKTLCKVEQRSCWLRRPLRDAQRHYAALDAFVLLQLASVMVNVPLTNPALLAVDLRRATDRAQRENFPTRSVNVKS